ncbi:MAG: hypothetical protein NTY35_09155 [Planctomycetota bacterium]|nr:hypothetical protein [Planctomycetota bacterium]
MTQTRVSFVSREKSALAVVLAATLAACSGGGGGSSGSSSSFRLVESNLNANQEWRINRAMTFQFTQPVDLNSVNLNTISVTRVGGAPAAGSFSLLDAYTVSFQPTCPTQDNFTDAGLQPGGLRYIVDLVASSTGGATVRSTSGNSLAVGLTTEIVTPNSTDLAVLFDDVQTGPPSPLIWDGTGSLPQSGVTYIEEGGSPDSRFVFKRREDGSANNALGAEVAVVDYTAPLNLYSVTASSVAVVVELDQPVDPSASNINPTAVKLQYCSRLDGLCGSNPADWIDLPHTVELEANCVGGGAAVRVTPVGILPLGRVVRVALAASFRDLVGNGNLLDLPVGSFLVEDGIDEGSGLPNPVQDEFLETFSIAGQDPASSQDAAALLDAPLALWGDDGTLAAGFEFGGTGGPGGNFDWRVTQLPGGGTTILNTAFSVIQNDAQTATQTIVSGQVDVRNLIIDQGGILDIRGPFPCVIRASGNVTINGKLLVRGVSNRGVSTFNSTNLPESGGAGNGGGGRGGTGNILTTQSSPIGETGVGAFDQANGGGAGGETGYNSSTDVNFRRGAGGGGGSLGAPMILFTPTTPFNVNGCPDQRFLGLDSEDGSLGSLQASGAISGPGQRPRGGTKGPRPFLDANPDNDFFGLMRVGSAIVRGELGRAWAGAGGGGGGNCVQAASFPNPMWSAASDEKGSGGGGGGGSLTILCLGDVVFGANGRIDAGGGTGGGGENTSGVNRVGAGSGGGSGGHVIIQVGKTIDFRLTRTNQALERDKGGIWTKGGQGGEGRDGNGGAGPNGVETGVTADRLPRDHYVTANGGIATPAPCAVAATGNAALGPTAGVSAGEGIAGCGGDGGPGIIQLHAPTLADILVPTFAGENLTACLKPNPIGSTIRFGATALECTSNVNTPAQWNQLLPGFGRISKAQSKWIALGSTSVSPTTVTPETTEFLFGGVDGSGRVLKTGSGSTATQAVLPSILGGTGSQVIVTAPSTPYITSDKRTVVLDGTTLADDIYLSNPSLLRFFDVRFDVGASTSRFDVASATYEGGLLRVTVATSGLPLASIPTDGTASLSIRPRFFRVKTTGALDSLPDPATVKFEFQATSANTNGQPDEAAATPFVTDINQLNTNPNNAQLRFFRFRVTFDLGLTDLSATTPIPSIDYLRVPFRF